MKTIEELRALLDKATPGPWSKEWLYGALRHINKNVDTEAFFGDHCDDWKAYDAGDLNSPGKEDAEFIVAMHESLIPLLDRLEAAEAALKKIADWECTCRWAEDCDCKHQLSEIAEAALATKEKK